MLTDRRQGGRSKRAKSDSDEEAYPRNSPEVAQPIAKGLAPAMRLRHEFHASQRRAATTNGDANEIVGFASADESDGGAKVEALSTSTSQLSTSTSQLLLPPKGIDPPRGNVDAVVASHSGAFFVIGWADTRSCSISTIQLNPSAPCHRAIQSNRLIRFRRLDAEGALELKEPYLLGFCWFASEGLNTQQLSNLGSTCPLEMKFVTGAVAVQPVSVQIVDDRTLRDLVIGYIANMQFHGNFTIESLFALDNEIGDQLVAYNTKITNSIVSSAVCERFGSPPKNCKASIVVCLYGKPEYQFIQNALFSMSSLFAHEYEFVYVSNSPELSETLCKIGDIGQEVYGTSVAVIMLTGNAGFGAANNVAVNYTRSDRVIILNPDVFPKDVDWAEKHQRTIEEFPRHQTKIFGSRLFYADGSLMHGGMYFERDWGMSIDNSQIRKRPILRVQHYGKGASPQLAAYSGSRPVPAVTGAFISIEKAWFESLKGFNEGYIFGHYEDADLCLRSTQNGVVPWIHDIDMWHLEGKGGTRLPHHDGASILNRWRFTNKWHEWLTDDLIGPTPRLPTSPAGEA